MKSRICLLATLFCCATVIGLAENSGAPACCPVPPKGKPVVNADQTVVILWDPATKMEHFVRRASFKSDADDFGFLIPTPSQPELNESGDGAFPYLEKLTEPEIKLVKRPPQGIGCGCSKEEHARGLSKNAATADTVKVLAEKSVAGFKGTVLEASSAKALTGWLKENGYNYSPEVEAWAKPYVDMGWKMTALKVEKAKDAAQSKNVSASALRLSFKTDRPLFPYREPDSTNMATKLGAAHRLLRIYFVADARYQGKLGADIAWPAKVAWSGKINLDDRKQALDLLKLPEAAGPREFWLTEFEDDWPYKVAPGDLYFAQSDDQSIVKRPPVIQYVSSNVPSDFMFCALGIAVIAPPLVRRLRRKPID